MSGLLLAVLLVPFVTAGVTLLTGHRSDVAAKGISVGGSALGLAARLGARVHPPRRRRAAGARVRLEPRPSARRSSSRRTSTRSAPCC